MFADNMEVPVFSDKVTQQLKLFAQQCMSDASLLHDPKLSYIKDLIEHYGGKVPEAKTNDSSDTKTEFENKPEQPQFESVPESEESEESDLELDMTGVIGLSYIFIFCKSNIYICIYIYNIVFYNKYVIICLSFFFRT